MERVAPSYSRNISTGDNQAKLLKSKVVKTPRSVYRAIPGQTGLPS